MSRMRFNLSLENQMLEEVVVKSDEALDPSVSKPVEKEASSEVDDFEIEYEIEDSSKDIEKDMMDFNKELEIHETLENLKVVFESFKTYTSRDVFYLGAVADVITAGTNKNSSDYVPSLESFKTGSKQVVMEDFDKKIHNQMKNIHIAVEGIGKSIANFFVKMGLWFRGTEGKIDRLMEKLRDIDGDKKLDEISIDVKTRYNFKTIDDLINFYKKDTESVVSIADGITKVAERHSNVLQKSFVTMFKGKEAKQEHLTDLADSLHNLFSEVSSTRGFKKTESNGEVAGVLDLDIVDYGWSLTVAYPKDLGEKDQIKSKFKYFKVGYQKNDKDTSKKKFKMTNITVDQAKELLVNMRTFVKRVYWDISNLDGIIGDYAQSQSPIATLIAKGVGGLFSSTFQLSQKFYDMIHNLGYFLYLVTSDGFDMGYNIVKKIAFSKQWH